MASFGKESDSHGLENDAEKPSSGFHWVVIRFATARLALASPRRGTMSSRYHAFRSRCLSCGILPSGITQRSIATTAEIHLRCNSSACAVPVKAVTPAAFEAKIADCRVAISAKHLTSTWRTLMSSLLSVACSEMTESSRLRFDCGPSRCVSATLMKPNNLKGGTS